MLYNKSRYAADWLGQGAGYTLQHSLDPTKPLYDTEWHSIGTLQWRDEHMSAKYVELAVWFSLYHYLAVSESTPHFQHRIVRGASARSH